METLTYYPQVSIIIPVYNAGQTIERCIRALLEQSYPSAKIESIIVNNNSTDNTQSIIDKFDVTSIQEKKPGPSAARNTGIRKAKGEYFIFTDADCVAAKDWVYQLVRTHLNQKEKDSKCKIIGGSIEGINKNFWSLCDDFSSWSSNRSFLPARSIAFNPTANISISREIIVEENLYFDEDLFSGEDVAYCKALTDRGYKLYFNPKAVIYHINRTSLKDLVIHGKSWAKSEFLLKKKKINTNCRYKIMPIAFLFYAYLACTMIGVILFRSIQAKRFKVFLCLPFITLNKITLCWYSFLAELQYSKYLRKNKYKAKKRTLKNYKYRNN